MRKILVVAHGHPDLNKGGGEQAAYHFFKECLKQGNDAYFLARTEAVPHGGAAFSLMNTPREILMHTTHDDYFLFSNIKTRHLWDDFKSLIERIRPEVVFMHHYFFLGIEIIKIIKDTLPSCKIIMTLHEYHAICANGGLMKKTTGELCYKSGTLDCSQCLTSNRFGPGDFYLRKQYISSFFGLIDHFISPSHFLKQRYVDWGVDENKVTVIENGQPVMDISSSKVSEGDSINLCYIGQINPNKGLDVLLEAVNLLPEDVKSRIQVDIHGSGLDKQSDMYQARIKKLIKKNKNSVRLHGRYQVEDVGQILSSAHWVVVPSIWWENSPMVIQEALSCRVPLIVSDIGGMAEKVQDGITGMHFRAGKALALADVIKRLVDTPELRDTMISNIQPPLTIESAYNKTLEIVEQC